MFLSPAAAIIGDAGRSMEKENSTDARKGAVELKQNQTSSKSLTPHSGPVQYDGRGHRHLKSQY